MSHDIVRHEPQGLPGHDGPKRASSRRIQEGFTTEVCFNGHRDSTAPVGDERAVIVDGEPLGCRYDLLSASPSGFNCGYGGRGPSQLAIAIPSHVFDDELACDHYQTFNDHIVVTLSEAGKSLTGADPGAWRKEGISNA